MTCTCSSLPQSFSTIHFQHGDIVHLKTGSAPMRVWNDMPNSKGRITLYYCASGIAAHRYPSELKLIYRQSNPNLTMIHGPMKFCTPDNLFIQNEISTDGYSETIKRFIMIKGTKYYIDEQATSEAIIRKNCNGNYSAAFVDREDGEEEETF